MMADISVEYVDHMGTDLTVVNAARVSFKEHRDELHSTDERLINYLASHNHYTTFTHNIVTLRLKVPIFLARQLMKHTVGLTMNEVSRRYYRGESEFYNPTWRHKPEGSVKQGSGDDMESTTGLDRVYALACQSANNVYGHLMKEGVCAEQARMILPQSMMTEYYWTGSLAAFARVYHLRIDSHAQKEAQIVAKRIGYIMEELYPISWEALKGDK